MLRRILLPLLALSAAARAAPLGAQGAAGFPTEAAIWMNPEDSTYLTGTLTLPRGAGPHRGVVLLSIAGVDPLVHQLAERGFAVLVPVRRGFVAVEPLLQATYQDLAGDARAALEHLRSRPDVDDRAVALIGQADDAPPAMLAAAALGEPVPLLLLAPPGFPGREVFRLEQGGMATRRGYREAHVAEVERLAERITDVVLGERNPYFRGYLLQQMMDTTAARLPYNAAFPDDEGQIHFFASPLWHDRLAFEPEPVLSRQKGPVLVLIGVEDPDTPLDAYVEAIRRGLDAAPTRDGAVCVLPDRTRHSFTRGSIDAVVGWLEARVAGREGALPAEGCR